MKIKITCPDCEWKQIEIVVSDNLKLENHCRCRRCGYEYRFRNPLKKKSPSDKDTVDYLKNMFGMF